MDWQDEYEEAKKRTIRRPFPSLSQDSEFEQLSQIGGPMPFDPAFTQFFPACSTFREEPVLEILMQFGSDLASARRHWPWVAVAAEQFKFSAIDASTAEKPTPTDVSELLKKIRADAEGLQSSLEKLTLWHMKSRDLVHARKRGHLEYLEAVLALYVAGFRNEGSPSDTNPMELWRERLRFSEWRSSLNRLITGVRTAQKSAKADLLTTPIRVKTPGLHQFISGLAIVWESLTKRSPSANKVHRSTGDSVPDFVKFVQAVSELAGREAPSRSQVASALKHLY